MLMRMNLPGKVEAVRLSLHLAFGDSSTQFQGTTSAVRLEGQLLQGAVAGQWRRL